MKLKLGLGLLGLMMGSLAFAAPYGPYLVGEIGLGYPNGNELSGLISSGNSTVSAQNSTTSNLTERFAIGDYLSRLDSVTSVGLELGYDYFNQSNSSASTNLPNGSWVLGTQQSSAWATTLDAIISFDIFSKTDFFAKLGMGYASIDRNFNIGTGAPVSIGSTAGDSSGFGISGGVGMQFDLTQNIGLRFEGDGFTGEDRLSYGQGLAGLVFGFSV